MRVRLRVRVRVRVKVRMRIRKRVRGRHNREKRKIRRILAKLQCRTRLNRPVARFFSFFTARCDPKRDAPNNAGGAGFWDGELHCQRFEKLGISQTLIFKLKFFFFFSNRVLYFAIF